MLIEFFNMVFFLNNNARLENYRMIKNGLEIEVEKNREGALVVLSYLFFVLEEGK